MPITLRLFSLHRVRVLVLLLCECVAGVWTRITLSANGVVVIMRGERERERVIEPLGREVCFICM